jgi:hypothetical protein
MAFISHRENSKTNWGREIAGDSNTDRDDIQLGCLLRIADATEAMAKNYVSLQNSLDYYKRAYQEEQQETSRLRLQASALRGVITKLKKARA